MSLAHVDERIPTGREKSLPSVRLITLPAQRVVVRPCQCGHPVRADRFEPLQGVRYHQRTNAHRAWREANGL